MSISVKSLCHPHLGRHHGLPRIGATQTGAEEHEGLEIWPRKWVRHVGLKREKQKKSMYIMCTIYIHNVDCVYIYNMCMCMCIYVYMIQMGNKQQMHESGIATTDYQHAATVFWEISRCTPRLNLRYPEMILPDLRQLNLASQRSRRIRRPLSQKQSVFPIFFKANTRGFKHRYRRIDSIFQQIFRFFYCFMVPSTS